MTAPIGSDPKYGSDPFQSATARRGSLSLDACLIKEIERSSRLRVASCRPVMALRLAPQPQGS